MAGERHPIRNPVIVGLIIALSITITSAVWPWFRSVVGAAWRAVCDFLASPLPVPGWLVCILTIGTIAFVGIWVWNWREVARTPAHDEYTQDTFNGMLWRWEYDFGHQEFIINLRPFCPREDTLLTYSEPDSGETEFLCVVCKNRFKFPHPRRDIDMTTRIMIDQKIRSGEWKSSMDATT